MTTTTVPVTTCASTSERRILGLVLALSILLIGTNGAISFVARRVNTALKRGDWATADRLQRFWNHATPTAVRAGLLQAVWVHDYSRAHLILTHCPSIRLDTFVRQQIGDFDDNIIYDAEWSSHNPNKTSPEDPRMLETLLDNGANANATRASDSGDPARTPLGILLSHRSHITDPLQRQKSKEMERILRDHGARLSVYDAARFGDMPELKQQLNAGADPNEVDWVGRPLIYLAAMNDQIDSARLLMQRGASVDVATAGASGIAHDTPLTVAERRGHVQLAELLIKGGASTDQETVSSQGFSSLPLIPAAGFGDINHIRFLIAHGARLNARLPGGATPLMFACLESTVSGPMPLQESPGNIAVRSARQSAVVDLLLRSGGSVNDRDSSGRTALMDAVWSAPITSRLVAHGADVNFPNNFGFTPLMEAVHLNTRDVFQILLAFGADVNRENFDGITALGVALREDANGLMNPSPENGLGAELQKRGAHLSLREAAIAGNVAEFRWRMAHGASLNVFRVGRIPLLESAVRGGNMEIVKLLLNAGVPVDAANPHGWTPLMTAVEVGRQDLAKLLLDSGARKDLRNVSGETALDIALRYHHNDLQPLFN